MENIITIEQQVKDLKREGLSFRKIADKLGVSLGKVQRVLSVSDDVSIQNSTGNEGVESVSANPLNRIDTPKECPKTEGTQLEGSVADLQKKLILIEERLSTMQDEFNKRIERIIIYYMEEKVESFILKEIKALRGELIKLKKVD